MVANDHAVRTTTAAAAVIAAMTTTIREGVTHQHHRENGCYSKDASHGSKPTPSRM
jgi:hypothetical protein